MTLPEGVGRIEVDGEERLATRGEPVYGEPTQDGWRVWDRHRSKLGAMLDAGMDVGLGPSTRVLYLGAGAGTTVSHLADCCRVVYAVEFAPRPMKRLLEVARDRPAIVPLLADARDPASYAHVVEAGCDLLVQDVATTGQAGIAVDHRPFLADDGRLALAIKARSEDVTATPADVFDAARERLGEAYDVRESRRLDPAHGDHLGVVATPR